MLFALGDTISPLCCHGHSLSCSLPLVTPYNLYVAMVTVHHAVRPCWLLAVEVGWVPLPRLGGGFGLADHSGGASGGVCHGYYHDNHTCLCQKEGKATELVFRFRSEKQQMPMRSRGINSQMIKALKYFYRNQESKVFLILKSSSKLVFFRFIWISMSWVYSNYKYFTLLVLGTVFGCQILTSTDVRFWRLKSISAL